MIDNEQELKEAVENQLSNARTIGLKLGSQMIASAIFDVIEKNIHATEKPSLRDYKRCVKEIVKIISVPLTQQNDSEGTV